MVVVAIAVDRYLSICWPMVGALTPRRAWLVTTVLALFAAAIGLCVALMYSVRHYDFIAVDAADDQNTTSTADAGGRHCLVTVSADDDEAACSTTSPQSVRVQIDHGECYPAYEVFSADFIWYFQKCYIGLFLVCFIAVVVIYVLIYRSVFFGNKPRAQSHRVTVN